MFEAALIAEAQKLSENPEDLKKLIDLDPEKIYLEGKLVKDPLIKLA